jgi:hypothetical protein
MTPGQYSHIRAHLSAAARKFGGIDYVSPTFGMVRAAMDEVDRLRAELAALPAPVVEQGFRDEFGTVHPLTHFPAETVAEVLKTNPALQRTVRISEWTEVAS